MNEEKKQPVSLAVNGVITIYDSIEKLLDAIDVNWDVASVCLHYQGKVRWIFKDLKSSVVVAEKRKEGER